MKTFITRALAMATMLLVLPGSAFACDACYGDTSGDRQGYAATVGIFAMVVIMFVMLGAVVGFGFYLNYRAKHPLPDYSELINDDPAQPNPGTTP